MLKGLTTLESGNHEAVMTVIELTFLGSYPTPLLAALHNCADRLRPSRDECAETEMVALLLEYGASVRLRSVERRPILHVVTEMSRADLVNMVLDHGAPVNARDGEGDTALAVAILRRPLGSLISHETSITKLLVQRGASLVAMCDWDTVDEDGAMRAATRLVPIGRRSSFFAYALASVAISWSEMGGRSGRWAEGTTDMHLACLVPDKQIFEVVLERVVDVNTKDVKNLTAFEYCAIVGNQTGMEQLAPRGADIHGVDRHGLSLLHRAVLAQRVDLIEFLVQHGEDVNRRVSVPDGYDALANPDDSYFIPSCDPSSVGELFKTYATRSQITPIQLAVMANKRESTTALLSHHAALDAFRYPAMPLYFGAIHHSMALVKQLQRAGCKHPPQDTTLSVIMAMADSLRINTRGGIYTRGGKEEFANSCLESLGWSISDLENLHDEQDETAQAILFHGLEEYQDLYLLALGKSVLEVIEEGFREANEAEAAALDDKGRHRWFRPRSRSSSMLAEFESAGVLAVEPPVAVLKIENEKTEANDSHSLSRFSWDLSLAEEDL